MAVSSVQEAHDALLSEMPEGASHEACPLCPAGDNAEQAKEAADVTEPNGRTFTEDEHFAVMAAAVQRETADLTAQRDELKNKLDAAASRLDVLEAEKAAAVAERDKNAADFDAFKQGLEELAAVAERKDARVSRVKAANEQLPESFYTDERAQRWAEMAEEAFEAYIADISAAKTAPAAPAPKPETAAFSAGQVPATPQGSVLGRFLGVRSASTTS